MITSLLKRFDIPATEPEHIRRRRLLDVLVILVAFVVIVQEIIVFLILIFDLPIHPPLQEHRFRMQSYIGSAVALLACGIIFLINRKSPSAARLLFVVFLIASVYMNTPDNWTLAVLTYALSIPIVIAAFLLFPSSSFIAAGISGIVTSIVGAALGIGIYVTPIFNFFSVSILAWFTARALEQALADWRILNAELDQRVRDRTRDLAEALARNQAILDSTADGVIVFDTAGQAIIANPAITAMIGAPGEKVIGQDVKKLLKCEAETEDDRRDIVALVSTGGVSETALKFQWSNKTLSATIAPVHVESSEASIGTVAVFRDFTREAEIDRMKSTFVSIASHELRTPLNAILGYTELLYEQVYGPLSDRQRNATERILANTNHMLSLANNLLDRAQIEAGTLQLNLTTFSPADVISEAVGAMEILARQGGLELTGQVADDVPSQITGDRQRVSQIVVNLIGNALKFTHEGGVRLRAYRPNAEQWAIAVTDTGVGIAKEAQSYIFEPFRRADESPTREYRGAGLGLSIVRQLVEMMGGRIDLESEPGQGSTFTITLPLTPPTQDEGEGDRAQR